jgi:hypothetical protein
MKIRSQSADTRIRSASTTATPQVASTVAAVEPPAAQACADRFGEDKKAFAGFFPDVTGQLERWDLMHRSVPPIPVGEARLKMTWARSDPMWPELKAMGFKTSDAYAIWRGLRGDDHFRKTSVGFFRTTKPDDALKALTDTLKAEMDSPSERIIGQLEYQISKYITDSPADLIEHPEVQAALETVLLSHAKLLQQNDKDSLKSYFFSQ